MTKINSFEQLLHKCSMPPVALAVVCPYDHQTVMAVRKALHSCVEKVFLVGDKERISQAFQEVLDEEWKQTSHRKDEIPTEIFSYKQVFIEVGSDVEAASRAVQLVCERKANVLMKGLINSDDYLRAILNKNCGLLQPGAVLSHLGLAEIPSVGRLVGFSDVAVIPYPTLVQRKAQIGYLAELCRALGIETPRIAMLHFSEHINPKFSVTSDYQVCKDVCFQLKPYSILIDGPMDVATALKPEFGNIKGIQSAVAGRADALLFPDIEAGNTFYKTINLFPGVHSAGVLMGAVCPVVLTSRADSFENKWRSILLAAIMNGQFFHNITENYDDACSSL